MLRRLTVVRPQVSFSKVDGVACHVVLEVLARVLAKAVGDNLGCSGSKSV